MLSKGRNYTCKKLQGLAHLYQQELRRYDSCGYSIENPSVEGGRYGTEETFIEVE